MARSLIHDPLLQQTPMHGVIIKWCCQPRFISTISWFSPGGPFAAKQTIHGSHSWSGGPSTATICRSSRSGGRLWRGNTCGVTGLLILVIGIVACSAAILKFHLMRLITVIISDKEALCFEEWTHRHTCPQSIYQTIMTSRSSGDSYEKLHVARARISFTCSSKGTQ